MRITEKALFPSFSRLRRWGEININLHGSLEVTPRKELRNQYPKILKDLILEFRKNHPFLKPLIVGMAGPRNATKSSTTQALIEMLTSKLNLAAICMDNYFLPRDAFKVLGKGVEKKGKDPMLLDFKRLVDDLTALCQGKEILVKVRDRYAYDYRGPEVVISGRGLDLILVEGLSAFYPNNLVLEGRIHNPYISLLSSFFAIKIYLSIDPYIAEKVAFFKNEKRRNLGFSSLADGLIYRRFRMVELPRFDGHHRLVRSNADIVCDLTYFNHHYQLSTIKISESFLEKLFRREGP